MKVTDNKIKVTDNIGGGSAGNHTNEGWEGF